MLFVSAKVSQYALLPQGQPERMTRALNMVAQMDKEGFGSCTNTGACEAECPKEISVMNIARLNREGHAVLLTTHYLEEAEALCGRIAMLKQGRVVALERTSDLLSAASSNVLRFKLDAALPEELARKARVTGRIVQFPAHNAAEIEHYLAAVRQAGLHAEDVEIRKADLEDVFLDVMACAGKHTEAA